MSRTPRTATPSPEDEDPVAGLAHWRVARTASRCARRAWHQIKAGLRHREDPELTPLILDSIRAPAARIPPGTSLAGATEQTLRWLRERTPGSLYGARLVAGDSYTELILERDDRGTLIGIVPRGSQHPGRARGQAEPIARWQAAVLARHGVPVDGWVTLHPDRTSQGASPSPILRREPLTLSGPSPLHPIERLADEPDEPAATPGRHCHTKHDPCPMRARCGGPEHSSPPPDPRAANRQALQYLRAQPGPFAYLDFEFYAPLVPIAPGHRTRAKLPVQFSVHLGDLKRVEHHGWLVPHTVDPTTLCAEALARTLDHEPTLIVWGRDEADMLRSLAARAPQSAPKLRRLASACIDLQRVVAQAWPTHRRASLKRIAPALSPGFGWSDLDIRGGHHAARAWADVYRLPPEAPRAQSLRDQLQRYGRRDTEALVAVHRALDALLSDSSG